jgi:hypothetical protein
LFARWTGKSKKEQTMPALLPVVLLTAVHLVLPAGDVPNLRRQKARSGKTAT